MNSHRFKLHSLRCSRPTHSSKPYRRFRASATQATNFIDLIQFHLVCKILAKLSGLESERAVSDFRKRQRKFLCCVHQPHKQAREIRNFQVADLQRRLRNVQKSMMHVQSCCFADINRLLFCRSRCRLRRCCLGSPLL